MARQLSKKDLAGAGWGSWGKKLWKKTKKVRHHIKRHAKKAVTHAKKVAKKTLKHAKTAAIAAGKEMLEQGKEEAKNLISQTIEDAKEAAVSHVRKHVCSTVGSGFFDKDAKKLKSIAHKHLDSVHKKAMTHMKSGGKKGAGLEDHVAKAGDRFESSVERVKNSAKSRIRSVAGCEEGAGFRLGRGGALKKKKGAGYRVKGAGLSKGRKKKCTC